MESAIVDVQQDFAYCREVTERHYENFSVLSWFIPKPLRPHFWSVYAFCRGVDDLGDEFEGDRLAALDEWEQELQRCYSGTPSLPVFRALQVSIREHALEQEDFMALIEANRMDQRISEYETFADLRDYCRHSADPVGHLVLQLFGYRDEERMKLSDSICTALQIANHLQDVSRDAPRGRLYIPLEDLERFGVHPKALREQVFDSSLADLMAYEVERTAQMFKAGQSLEQMVPGRLSRQLSLYRLGGEAILDALRHNGYNPFPRPTVGTLAKGLMAARLVFSSRPSGR